MREGLLVVGHRANTARWLRRQLRCSDLVEVDVVAARGGLWSGHRGPEARPGLLRERVARWLSELHLARGLPLGALLAAIPRGVGVMLDLKAPVDAGRLLEAVAAAGRAPGEVLVSTRWHARAGELSRAGFRVLLSLDSRPASLGGLVGGTGAAGVSVRYSYVDRGLVEEAHGLGLVVAAWTVNTREDALRVLGAGVDMVVTDFPCRLRRWLGGG